MQPILNLVSIFSLLVSCSLAVWIYLMRKTILEIQARQNNFLSGDSNANLEDVLISVQKHTKKLSEDLKTLSSANRILAELQQKSFQRIGLVRFNSFAEATGNNSFSLVLADDLGNGILISSLFGRDYQRLYVKPLVEFQTTIPLTQEEKHAILESQNSANE